MCISYSITLLLQRPVVCTVRMYIHVYHVRISFWIMHAYIRRCTTVQGFRAFMLVSSSRRSTNVRTRSIYIVAGSIRKCLDVSRWKFGIQSKLSMINCRSSSILNRASACITYAIAYGVIKPLSVPYVGSTCFIYCNN